MRVMVMVKATEDSEAGVMPTAELFEAMGKFNEELTKAGIMMMGTASSPRRRASASPSTGRSGR